MIDSLHDVRKREHTDFGTWLVGDFSHMKDNGIYQAWCGNEPGPAT